MSDAPAQLTRRHPSRWAAAALAGSSVAAFWVTYGVFVHTHTGQALDTAAWDVALHQPDSLRRALSLLARRVLPWVLGALVVAGLVRASWPQRWTALIGLGTIPLAYGLREALARPNLGLDDIPGNTFPSTHAAAGFALVAALVVLARRPLGRRSRWALAGCLVVVAVGNVSWYAHRPSDVLGSALLVVAMLALAHATRPRSDALELS